MKRLIVGIFALALVFGAAYRARPAWAFTGSNPGSSSSGGGGTTITSGAGQFAAGTSQSGAVLTGVLAAPYGATTYTVHGMLLGEAGSNIAAMAACAVGSVAYGQGAADPICSTLILPNSATAGDLFAATSTNTMGSVADVAVNQILCSGGVGVIPAWCSTLPTAATAALTGDVTKSAGSNATTAVGGSNLVGLIGKVNAQGAIASGGTLSCDLSLGNVCAFSNSAGGTVTAAVPTNGVIGAQYYLRAVATATFTLAYTSATPGWRIYNPYGGTSYANPANQSLPSTNTGYVMIPFHYDGTNYDLDVIPFVSAIAGSIGVLNVNGITGGNSNITTVGGSFAVTGAGNIIESGGTGYIGSTKAASISGGGSLSTGSNSFAGRITGLAAASNVLTPSFTCPNAVTCTFQDDTTVGGVLVTAQSTTTITFSATASDTADYICSCR